MRAQSSLATLATSLALLTEPAFAADKTCGQTRSAYDSLMNPRLSQTDIDLGYKIPFSTCSSYGVEFGASLSRDITTNYRLPVLETTTKTNVLNILENTWNVQVYKKTGKETYGFGVNRGGIGAKFEERSRWVTTSFEFRIAPKNGTVKTTVNLQLSFQ